MSEITTHFFCSKNYIAILQAFFSAQFHLYSPVKIPVILPIKSPAINFSLKILFHKLIFLAICLECLLLQQPRGIINIQIQFFTIKRNANTS